MKEHKRMLDAERTESLEEIKRRFEKIGLSNKEIHLADLNEAISHLELTDEQNDDLLTFFKKLNIELIDDAEEEKEDSLDTIVVDENAIKQSALVDDLEPFVSDSPIEEEDIELDFVDGLLDPSVATNPSG